MTNQYLEWVDDKVLEAAAQYLMSRVQISNPKLRLHHRFTQVIQEEVLSKLDYSQLLAYDRLERGMSMFHRQILLSLDNWEAGNLDGTSFDLMNQAENIYVEFKSYFRYQYGTSYIDWLADNAQKYPDKRFYLVFVNGVLDNDILPARDRIELAYPQLENFFVVELEALYIEVCKRETAMQELLKVLPKLFRNVATKPLPPIFISYNRQNTIDMQKLKIALLDAGIPAWTDELLQAGTPDWQIAIEKSLENAACVVLILSPESKQSEWVRNELNYAKENGIPIIPFWVSGLSNEVSMLNLVTTQRIDARQAEKYELAIQQAIDSIERFIHAKLAQASQ